MPVPEYFECLEKIKAVFESRNFPFDDTIARVQLAHQVEYDFLTLLNEGIEAVKADYEALDKPQEPSPKPLWMSKTLPSKPKK